VAVESEIENIVGVEDGVGSDEALHAYRVEQLVEVATSTGTDLIAPQLGTAHGLYKAAPQLQYDRVAELVARTDLPIVLHGGTGLGAAEFSRFIAAGVAKINISTALKLAYLHAARDHLTWAQAHGTWEPVKLFAAVDQAVQAVVADHVEMFGSAGRARVVK
jgi:fructose-bisphosphate aldolase class II